MKMLSKRTWIVMLFLIVLKSNDNNCGISCPIVVGEGDPSQKTDHHDLFTGVAVLLNDTYKITTCGCGFVQQWEFYAISNGSFDAQVWRFVSGNTYKLVGENTLTATNPGNNEQRVINNGQRIRTLDGDFLGLYSAGQLIITYNIDTPSGIGGGGGRTRGIEYIKIKSNITDVTSSTNKDWSTASSEPQQYAINAEIVPNVDPTINNLAGISYYNDEVPVGSIVVTVSVTDYDLEDMDDLNLTITSVTNDGTAYFDIVSSSLYYNISVVAFPPVNEYVFDLRVEDPCGAIATGTQTVTIINRLPVMNNLPESIFILEDTGADELLFPVNATDSVTNQLTCYMTAGDTSAFKVYTISSTTDYGVYTANPGIFFNYDTTSSYSVSVQCDDDDGGKTDNGTLTINLIPNEPPVIHSLPDSTSFLEDFNTNTLLHKLNVSDATGDAVTCTLNANSTIFHVSLIPPNNTVYGIYLTGGTTLDYDTTSSYSMSVVCSDLRRNDTEIFTVNLIRNTPPVINNLPETTSMSEDLNTRTIIYNLNVTDVNVADTVTCWLTTNTDIFEVDVETPGSAEYAVFLKGGTILYYDTTPSYSLTIVCADHRRNVTDYLTVSVIPNEPPTIVNLPMSYEVLETTVAETLLYTVSVTDPTNDTITCSIATNTSIFYLQAGSTQFEAEIFVRGNQGFSYDTQRSYTLHIVCADQRRNDSEVFYIYLLRNNPPTFTNVQGKISLSARTVTGGQTVYTILGSDPENDQLQFSMTTKDASAPFSINQNTGEVSLTRSIQFETVAAYDLYFNVTDSRNVVGPKTLTVRITDINSAPTFKNVPQTVTVREGGSIGISVFQPIIYDAESTDSHTYTVSFDPPEGASYFQVNQTSGLISTLASIDYETISFKTFILEMTVSDSLLEDSGNVTINILDVNESPKFTKKYYSFSASEGSGGTQLQNPYYQYTDEDGDTVKFSFSCGENTGRLDMNQTTGILSYSSVSYDLDVPGTDSVLYCEVYCSDNAYSDIAYLNITILDENDNTPVFDHSEYTFFALVDTIIGSSIGQVKATDSDIGTYGDVSYHLSQGTLSFKVSSDGTITLLQTLDMFEQGSILNFTVYAVDSGGLEDSAIIYIVIPGTTFAISTVDETIKYLSFFSYAPNMAWFVPLMFIVFGTVCFVIHTMATGDWSCFKRLRWPKCPKKVRKPDNKRPKHKLGRPIRPMEKATTSYI